jgi:hypothetical protein
MNNYTVTPRFAFVKAELQALGLVIRKTEYGEYRVNFKGGHEATAYYTTDLADALDTGRTIAAGPKGGL